MLNIFFWLTLAIAALEWYAVAAKVRPLEYFAKPGTMVALLAWFLSSVDLEAKLIPFVLGFIFSLAGDVLLLLPGRFLFGLVAFLLGHLAYTVGFNLPPANPGLPALGLAAVLAIALRQLYLRLAPGLTGEREKMRVPVIIYAVVISAMLFSALITLLRGDWIFEAALLVSSGAFLFYISDALHSMNTFLGPAKWGRLIVMVTYHLGQIGIAAGVILNQLAR